MVGRGLRGVSYRDLLAGVVPSDVLPRLPRSFDIIGDIALIRLDDDLIAYGREVAEAIMRIHRGVRAVYARRSVEGSLRIQGIIHIGGERRTTTIYRENGILFSVDIASMYVNTRLASERLRIAQEIADGSLVLDLFSGYGGFALNIAKIRRAEVVANDINPYAVEHMKRSIAMNRLRGSVYPVISDSRNPPLRGEFDVVIADNPTNIEPFTDVIADLLKRGGKAYIYILAESPGNAIETIHRGTSRLEVRSCTEMKEYSPKLTIYRCIAHKT
ncbi:MAG: methyltransferase domain-containing protein [Sulfolobales archaeon]